MMTTSLRRTLFLLGLSGILAIGLVPEASADDPTARFSISGQVGLGGLAMSDVNDEISLGNQYMANSGWVTLEDIKSGFNFSGDLKFDVLDNWSVAFGITKTTGSTRRDFDEVIGIDVTGDMVQGKLLYRLPWRPIEPLRLSLAGGLIYLYEGKVSSIHEHRTVEQGTQRIETLEQKGKGWGGSGLLDLEMIISESITLVGDVGWRYLTVDMTEYDWKIERVRNPEFDSDGDGIPDGRDLSDRSWLRRAFINHDDASGPFPDSPPEVDGDIDVLRAQPIRADYSGIQGSVGLRFYLF